MQFTVSRLLLIHGPIKAQWVWGSVPCESHILLQCKK